MKRGGVVFLAVVIGCEIGFWVLLLAGLLTRYLLRAPRVGAALLLLAAGTQVVLLVSGAVDLARGSTASIAHVIAAIAVAIALVSGRHHLHTADRWVRRRLGRDHEAAPEAPLSPRDHARKKRREFRLRALEWLVAMALLAGGAALADFEVDRAGALFGGMAVWTIVLAFDFLDALVPTVKAAFTR
ncbi:hypothetical protein [Streptoalloteichus tenebrarius]|uniref:hypothetical protein n=1 Tax=Streptoalloteichus tenebrarius (strain ATCC 17920 / DSM 40477 / JCM 4838 / CBS 697.72 / NBRC 16177 / NCIMB 11028 / NRRL B-12390 / A12253. 1 / ISP 5477) TaxID=1933 RepID=UPI0020A2F517|nr:hypothetical protein [Streptoalloteichus tenebrarius]